MKNVRSVFCLGVDKFGLFDASSKGHSVSAKNNVRNIGDERTLYLANSAHLVINRSKEIDSLETFTFEATIIPERLAGRQNILEAQTPPIAFFIDSAGKLFGGIHTNAGWQAVDSGNNRIIAGRSSHVRFTRDTSGTMGLEINGRAVGRKRIAGKLKPVGEAGFKIGTWVDGRNYSFQGKISDVQIRKGALTSYEILNKRRNALTLENKIRQLAGAANVRVEAYVDVNEYRLQDVKGIINAVGVQDISKLSTLKINRDTVITPGKIMVAAEETSSPPPNWLQLARTIATQSNDNVRQLIATHLPNQNSLGVLRTASTTRRRAITPIPFRPKSTLARVKIPYLISNNIRLKQNKINILDPNFLNRIKTSKPSEWPVQQTSITTFLSTTTIPINSAVMVAKKLDLTNKQLKIEPTVETLYIIAEEIICGPKANITWRRPGGTTPAISPDPDNNGRSYHGIHTKKGSRDGLDGGDGKPGRNGLNGAKGLHSPKLQIWAKNMNAMPDIDLEGEDGIRGGTGQRGGHGGHGAQGNWGRKTTFLWETWCSTDPGDGGDGGDGGNGGRGGRAGNGGNGSKITIGVLEDTLASTVTAQSFKIKNEGGEKGRGGKGGEGGNGGRGGRSGNGEVCKSAKDGHNGAKGQRGLTGPDGLRKGNDGEIEFLEISEEAWDDLLSRPWLMELTPTQAFPESTVIIKGSRFTRYDRMVVDRTSLVPQIRADERLEIKLPANISGGMKTVFVRRRDGSESNRLRLWIKPQLLEYPDQLLPGQEVTLKGRAFVNGASVLIDGKAVPTKFISTSNLSFTMTGTGGEGTHEKEVDITVRNPDGMISNTQHAHIPEISEIGFDIKKHAFSFKNFAKGSPSWSTYKGTFGASEIWHELLDPLFGHPILTSVFYGFYHYFLKGEERGGLATGFCTSLSAVALDEFWTGSTDTHSRYKLTSSTRKKFTTIHGKLLSRESLITMHDQSREGLDRVVKTFGEIEKCFKQGCDRESAPMLFFIPQGAVWDKGYIDDLSSTHCIVPIRIIYPRDHKNGDLNGVKLYCWDCNHPPDNDTSTHKYSENCRLEFKKINGKIHFDYYAGGSSVKFSSQNGITIGMMNVGEYLLSDHDLPFSGPFGLTSFIIDFLLSPADLQIVDDDGRRTGVFGNKILSEIPDSRPCYLAKGAYMLPANTALTRKIIGNGTGAYTFNSITPDFTSIVIENVQTKPVEEDVLSVNSDGTQIRFTPAREKNFTLNLGRKIEHQVHGVTVKGIGGNSTADVDISLSPDLSVLRIGNRSSDKNVDVQVFNINTQTRAHSKLDRNRVSLPSNHDLVVAVTNWEDFDVAVRTVSFE